MKKGKNILGFFALVTFSIYVSTSIDDKTVKDIAFSNIEALADNEVNVPRLCIGSGSVDCNGYNVKVIYDNYNLKLE